MDNQLLNHEDHRDLKIIVDRSPELGDAVMLNQTFPGEFRNVQAHYPILFQKNDKTGDYLAVALFGLERNENLFLSEKGWEASYIPLMQQREPFTIGFQGEADQKGERSRVVHVDMDSPRVNTEDGIRLFEPHGAQTAYLEKVAAMLETLYKWQEENRQFMSRLAELDLLEPVTFDLTLNDGSQGQMVGFYTINEDRLQELSEKEVYDLHQKHYLQAIYMAVASLSNIRRLIDLKARRRA